MKIVISALDATYNHTNLAVRYLQAYLSDKNNISKDINVVTAEFNINDRIENILDYLYLESADVYAFSCYIWNIKIIERVASDLKLLFPNCYIIFGGPEVSFENLSYYKEKPYIDFIIRGPGEKALSQIISDLILYENNNDNASVSIKRQSIIDGEPIGIEKRIFPYSKEKKIDPHKQYYYETSVGCPYNCSYCLSSATKGVKSLSLERVKEELKFFIDNKIKIVKLVDRTFNCDEKRALAIWKYLVSLYFEKPYNTMFHFEISADILTKETIEFLFTVPKGLFRFECGIQSTNLDTLQKVNRKSNLNLIMQNIKTISEFGNIELHVDLIAGLPDETILDVANSFNEVFNLNPDMIQLGFLKVLKGSALYKKTQSYGIVSSKYPPYTVLKTNNMTYTDILDLQNIARIVDKFYNSKIFKYSMDYIVNKYFFANPFTMFESLAKEYKEKGGFDRFFSRKDDILFFFLFGNELKDQVFTDLLKFDYYRYDKKGHHSFLNMNMSFHHRSMSEEIEEEFKQYIKKYPKKVNPRTELYSFSISDLINNSKITIKNSFVLYDLAPDKPKILHYIEI